MRTYDLVVIGSGPAGQKAAIQAAKLGRSVAVVEKHPHVGGVAINTGTIPSKALREAVLHLTGAGRRGLFGESGRVKRDIDMTDLQAVSDQVIRNEQRLVREHLDRNGIDVFAGTARFEGPELLWVQKPTGMNEGLIASRFVIATGTTPTKPDSVPFDGTSIFTSDEVSRLAKLPRSMIVAGGGVIGVEYACMMSTLGVKVSLIEGRSQVLGFLDDEITEAFQYHMRQSGITLRLGEKVAGIEHVPAERQADKPDSMLVQATLESGKTIRAETLLYAVGRNGATSDLGLEELGLCTDDRGRLKVNEHFQTEHKHIYAVGDVIGFPALASTSMEQGRAAACHMFDVPCQKTPELMPYGIYAVPEISMVGRTEKQLTDAGIPYEAGVAQYRELARGQLLGDDTGLLKLLIHQKSRQILGVHIIGTGATELIHIGQAVMAFNGTADFFVETVFNYPTLAEAYKVAAYNGLNKLRNV